MDKTPFIDALRAVQTKDGLDNSLIKALPDVLQRTVVHTRCRNSTLLTIGVLLVFGCYAVAHVVSKLRSDHPQPQSSPVASVRKLATNQGRAPDD